MALYMTKTSCKMPNTKFDQNPSTRLCYRSLHRRQTDRRTSFPKNTFRRGRKYAKNWFFDTSNKFLYEKL